jgi:hypothetical protein
VFGKQDAIYREEASAILSARGDGAAFFGSNAKRAKLLYRRLAAMFHPDAFMDAEDKSSAEKVFKALGNLWCAYENACSPKSASAASSMVIGGVAYLLGGEAKHLSNSMFKAFNVISAEGDARILMIARKSDIDSGYFNLLCKIERFGVCADLFPCQFSDLLNINQADGIHAAFLLCIPGDVSCGIRSLKYVEETGKLDTKDIAWIWRRMVSAAAVCADLSIGFGFDTGMSYIQPEYHGYLHMSLSRDTRRTHACLSKAAEFMVSISDAMPPPMCRYFDAAILTASVSNPHPKELLADFDYVIEKLWGARKFHPFKYPSNWA